MCVGKYNKTSEVKVLDPEGLYMVPYPVSKKTMM